MAIAELPGDGPVELPAGEPPQMAGDEPAYITSPGGSPLTPPTDGMPGQIPRVMNRGMIMDEYGTMWYSDTDPEESDGHITDSEVQYNDLSNELPKAFGKRRPLEYIAESPIEYMAESPLEYPETPDDWPLSRRTCRPGLRLDRHAYPNRHHNNSILNYPSASRPTTTSPRRLNGRPYLPPSTSPNLNLLAIQQRKPRSPATK
jgi:hypothetical protein